MAYADSIEHAYDSIENAMRDLQPLEGAFFTTEGIDPTSGERKQIRVPKFLFRGEGGEWDTTISAMERIRRYEDPVYSKIPRSSWKAFFETIHDIVKRVDAEMQSWLKLSPMQSSGLLQHYELPTEFIDFTSKFKTAIGFAVHKSQEWTEAKTITLGVLDVERASKKSVITDFASVVEIAPRPERQNGFGLFSSDHVDLKSSKARADLGISWYSILANQQECNSFKLEPALLDLRSDTACGFFDLVMRQIASEDGGWPREVSRYLASRLAATPMVATRASDGSQRIELQMLDQSGLTFNEANYRLEREIEWSKEESP